MTSHRHGKSIRGLDHLGDDGHSRSIAGRTWGHRDFVVGLTETGRQFADPEKRRESGAQSPRHANRRNVFNGGAHDHQEAVEKLENGQQGRPLKSSLRFCQRSRMFKKACPARPQALWRAERTAEYVSTTKGRERRWQTFSTSC